ncbi:MAG: TrmH family RNA methyltransferase [Pirellulales bacterium]
MTARSITSPRNQRIKDTLRLRVAKHRAKQDCTLIDGAREVARALDAGISLAEVFVCESLCHSADCHALVARLGELSCPVWQVTPPVFERIAYGQRAEGVLAVAHVPQRSLSGLQLAPGALVAVACGLEKPGNLGALLRSADAAGLAAVIVADGGTDLYNPNCIRASLGTIFTQPVCPATSAATLTWLRERGAKVFAARVDAATDYTDADYSGETAIVLGSEAAGLPAAWRDPLVTPVKLPMRGSADSLNVSAAAAVLFYEALRQRTVSP